MAEAVNNLLTTVDNLPGSFVTLLKNSSLYMNGAVLSCLAQSLPAHVFAEIVFQPQFGGWIVACRSQRHPLAENMVPQAGCQWDGAG